MLKVPAVPRPCPEVVRMVAPWFARTTADPSGTRPVLSTFTDEAFVDDLFAGVSHPQSARGWVPAAWSPLRAFRDYAEPPSATFDALGTPRYAASHLVREPLLPGAVEPDPDNDDPTRTSVEYAEQVEWARTASRRRNGTLVPWLRKLYLPIHGHFHTVSFELVCERFDWPRVARERVLETGFVLRRLAMDTPPPGKPGHDPERWQNGVWEDWVVGVEDRGAWMEVADPEMTYLDPLDGQRKPIDPRELPLLSMFGEREPDGSLDASPSAVAARVWREAELRNRLGRVDSAPLSALVSPMAEFPSQEVGIAGEKTSFFGYVPLTSSEMEVAEPIDDPARWPDIVLGMAEDARALLVREVARQAAALQDDIHVALDDLASVLLPAPPADPSVPRAQVLGPLTFRVWAYRIVLGSFIPFLHTPAHPSATRKSNLLDAALETMLPRLLPLLWQAAPSPDLRYDTLPALSATDWWNAVVEPVIDTYVDEVEAGIGWVSETDITNGTAHYVSVVEHAWLAAAISTNEAEVAALLLDRLLGLLATTTRPYRSSSGWDDTTRHAFVLLAAMARRVRAHRIELLDAIYATVLGSEWTAARRQTTLNALDSKPPHYPRISTASVASEIEGWLELDAARDRVEPQWGNLPPNTAFDAYVDGLAAVHHASYRLEQRLGEVDQIASGATTAYVDEVAARQVQVETLLAGELGETPASVGVRVDEQPLRGLTQFPTFNPDFAVGSENWVERFAGRVEARLAAFAAVPPGDLLSRPPKGAALELRRFLRSQTRTARPRIDPDSLYAVWCFARVAPKRPCQPSRVVWGRRSEIFSVAEPLDLLGLRPTTVRLPDLDKMLRDIPRIGKAGSIPMAAVVSARNSVIEVGDEPEDTVRRMGIGWVCSYGIPVFTICAWIAFQIILKILMMIPGFAWLLLLRFCIPVGEE